jgi:hypothetical protein
MPSLVLTIVCTVLLLAATWLVSIQSYLAKPDKHPPPAEVEDTEVKPPEDPLHPTRTSPLPESLRYLWVAESSCSARLTEGSPLRASRVAPETGKIVGVSLIQKTAPACPKFVVSSRTRQIQNPSEFPHLIHAQSRYELEQEYERGMHTRYDETLGAIHFTGMQIVMNTPAEVELAFHVCKRQIRTALRLRGLERAPTLTDIRGIIIGRDATVAWGQALKEYLDEMCIKVDTDTYLLAHYNSQAPRPGQDQLQETIRRIQFMTSAAIYHFQSNIFDTREGAMAFLQRMRTVYRI